MNKIFLVRHGQFDNFGHLTEEGKLNIEKLAKNIKTFTLNTKSEIYSSPTDRTTESSMIIAQVLNINYEKTDLLLSDGYKYQMNLKKLHDFVKQSMVDNIILVTHFDYANDFPVYFMKNEYGMDMPESDVKKGEGIMIDCVNKTIIKI